METSSNVEPYLEEIAASIFNDPSRVYSKLENEVTASVLSKYLSVLREIWSAITAESHMPIRLLNDTSPMGSLFKVLSFTVDFFRQVDIGSIDALQENVNDCQSIFAQQLFSHLISEKTWSPPRIFFSNDIHDDDLIEKLSRYTQELAGTVVETDLEATHILSPGLSNGQSDLHKSEHDCNEGAYSDNQNCEGHDFWINNSSVDQQNETEYKISTNSTTAPDLFQEEEEDDFEIQAEDDSIKLVHYHSRFIARYPKVELVDLDKKTPNRVKRFEYEPLSNPKILNISDQTLLSFETINSKKKYTIPKNGIWFSMSKVSELEKMEFRDYFEPTEFHKSPEVYQSIRNSSIQTYIRNPQKYLTVSVCASIFDQNLRDILRIHSFLEIFGLINYQAGKEEKLPIYYNANSISVTNPLENNIVHTCLSCDKLVETSCFYRTIHPYNYTCCVYCYLEGKFPSGLSSNSFVKLTTKLAQAHKNQDEIWTDADELKLLTYFETYGDDWERISQYIDGKSPSDCVKKFLLIHHSSTIDMQDCHSLFEFFEHSENSIISLIQTIAMSFSVSLASVVASSVLKCLLEKNDLSQSQTIVGLDSAYSLAISTIIESTNSLLNLESKNIQDFVKHLIEAQCSLCERKLQICRDLSSNNML